MCQLTAICEQPIITQMSEQPEQPSNNLNELADIIINYLSDDMDEAGDYYLEEGSRVIPICAISLQKINMNNNSYPLWTLTMLQDVFTDKLREMKHKIFKINDEIDIELLTSARGTIYLSVSR
jgi:hypothetical protein